MKMDVRKKLEQIRRGKKNSGGSSKPTSRSSTSNVKDLRQIISKKTKKKVPASRDLRETNKKLVSRKKATTTAPPPTYSRTDTRPMTRATKRTVITNPISVSGRHHYQQPEQQYYVPPPIRRNQPIFVAPHPMAPPRTVVGPLHKHDAPEHHAGASVLISNLNPTITQSDIIELYGEVGSLTAVNMINQNTALVTYQSSSDAFKAVKVYHNRLLDGRPMLVNMMPTSV